MNIKEISSNFTLKSEFTETANNAKQNDLTSTFNGKKIKIVVAARQYMAGSIFARGYGDIASGVRGLEYLMKIYPSAQFSFVVEHFADSKSELSTIKTIATIPDVKTFILNGRRKFNAWFYIKEWQQEHQENEVKQLLQDADFIFHGPAGLIAPLKNSKGEYAKKTVGVSEYERNTGYYNKDDPHGIANFNMGLNYNRIYINERPLHKNQFQDNILRSYCSNPILDKKVNNNKNKFYFHYSHNIASLAQMLRIMVLIEGDCDRSVGLVSSIKFNIEMFQNECFDNLLLESCSCKAVKLCGINNNAEHAELILHGNLQRHEVKNIHLITPTNLSNNDFQLLQQGSVINYSTGDISASDVLALGKIPIFGVYSKKCFFLALLDKIKAFCMIAGNEQYQSLIDVWILAASNFTREAQWKLPKKSLTEIKSLQQLRSLKWQAFERKFTDWLKANNQTEVFIRDQAEAIIT